MVSVSSNLHQGPAAGGRWFGLRMWRSLEEPGGAWHCQGSWCEQGSGAPPGLQFGQQERGKESSAFSLPSSGTASSILLLITHRDDLLGSRLVL